MKGVVLRNSSHCKQKYKQGMTQPEAVWAAMDVSFFIHSKRQVIIGNSLTSLIIELFLITPEMIDLPKF